jgi:hypothetical protein
MLVPLGPLTLAGGRPPAIARAALDPDRRVSEELGLGWHLPSYQMVRAAER